MRQMQEQLGKIGEKDEERLMRSFLHASDILLEKSSRLLAQVLERNLGFQNHVTSQEHPLSSSQEAWSAPVSTGGRH